MRMPPRAVAALLQPLADVREGLPEYALVVDAAAAKTSRFAFSISARIFFAVSVPSSVRRIRTALAVRGVFPPPHVPAASKRSMMPF